MKHKRIWTALLAVLLVFALAAAVCAASAEDEKAAEEAFRTFFSTFYPLYLTTYLLSLLATVFGGALCAFVYLYLREKKKLDNNRRFFGPEPQSYPYPQPPVAAAVPLRTQENVQTPWGGNRP